MNYIKLQHCINQKLLEACKDFDLNYDEYYNNYWYRVKRLEQFIYEDDLSKAMYKSHIGAMNDIAEKSSMTDRQTFMKHFPYHRFKHLYGSVGRHDLI
jgi:hypothetical protein